MIGIIPRLWVHTLRHIGKPEQVAQVLAAVGHPPDFEYALDQPYTDAECAALMQASQTTFQLDEQALFASFAHTFMQDSLQRWPVWFEMSPTARDFLERQPRIHERFNRSLNQRELQSGAYTPKFQITATTSGLQVHYQSPNKLCRLYMAMARELLSHYQDLHATLHETRCMHRDDEACEIHISWPATAESAA